MYHIRHFAEEADQILSPQGKLFILFCSHHDSSLSCLRFRAPLNRRDAKSAERETFRSIFSLSTFGLQDFRLRRPA